MSASTKKTPIEPKDMGTTGLLDYVGKGFMSPEMVARLKTAQDVIRGRYGEKGAERFYEAFFALRYGHKLIRA